MSKKSDVLNRTFTLLPDSDCENEENDSSEEQQDKNENNNSNIDCNINNCTTNIDNANRTTIIKFESSPISLAKLNDSFTIDKYINDFLNSPTLVLLYNKYLYENDLKLILNFLKKDFSTYDLLFNEQFYEAIIDESNYRKFGVSSDDDVIEMKNSPNMRFIANTTQTIENNNDSSQNLSNNDNNLNKTNVIDRKYVLDNDDIRNIDVANSDHISNNLRSLSEIDIATLSSVDVVTSSPRFKLKRTPISSNLPDSNSNSSNTDFDFHGSTPSLDSNSDEDKRVLNITYTSFEVDDVQLEKDLLKQNANNQGKVDTEIKTSSNGSLDNFTIVKRSFENYQFTDGNNFKQTTELNNNIAETNNKENLNSTYSLDDDDDDDDDMDVDVDEKMDVDEDNNNKMCANQNNDNQSTNCNRTIIIENKITTPKIETNNVKLESNIKKPVFRSPLPAPQIPTPSSPSSASVSPSNSSSLKRPSASSNSDIQAPPVQQSGIPKPSGIPRSGIPRVTGIPQRTASTTTSQQSSQQTSIPKVVQQSQQSSNEGKLSVISNNTTSIKQTNTYNQQQTTSLKSTGIQQRSIQPPTQINRLTNNNVNTLSSKENKFNTDYSQPNNLIIKSNNQQNEVKQILPTTNQAISVNQDTKKIIKKGAIPTCKPSLISTTTPKPAATVSYKVSTNSRVYT